MTKEEIKLTAEQYVQLYRIAYDAWQKTGSDACKKEAEYLWSMASKAIDKCMEA